MTPDIQWLYLLPILVVFGAGVIGVLVESFMRNHEARRTVQIGITAVAIVAALTSVFILWNAFGDAPYRDIDGFTLAIEKHALLWQGMIAVFALLSVVVFAARSAGEDAFTSLAASTPGSPDEALASRRGMFQTEVYPLMLFAVGGMMMFTIVQDVIALFVVLEVFSLPLYLMVGLARRRRLLSQEAAVKYFLTGAFASAVYLFGAVLMYGYVGATSFGHIADALRYASNDPGLPTLAIGLMLVGLLFKLGAAPFHAWTPDAYQGAPTAVTGFMAAATKAAAAAALLRLTYSALARGAEPLDTLVWTLLTISVISMVVGTTAALAQRDVKRMLAYSSVAHAGFLLVAVVSFDEAQALTALPFYMLVYGVATVGAFAIVSLVRNTGEDGALGAEATGIDQWAGLGKRAPWMAAAMSLFLLSFAGIPLTAGFVGKFLAFRSALENPDLWWLVTVAVLVSAAAAYFYVRLIVAMYFTDAPEGSTVAVASNSGISVVVGFAALVTVVLGVYPTFVLDLAARGAALFVP